MDRKTRLAVRGATNATTFRANPEQFSPLEARRNFRAHNVGSGRPGGSRRPCLGLLVDRQLRNAPVNGLAVIRRARAVSGYTIAGWTDIGAGTTSPAGPLLGQIAGLSEVPSMDWFTFLNVTANGGPTTNPAQSCALAPDNSFLAVASNYTVGGFGRFTVARIDPSNGRVVWQTENSSAGKHRSVNTICVTRLYTFVAIATSDHSAAAPLLLGFRNDTGALAISGTLGGWANEAVTLARYEDTTGQEWLYVGFLGSTSAGTYTGGIGGGVIKAGRWGLDFRGGVMKFRVEGTTYGGGGTTMVPYGRQLASTDPYYEAAHGYWRGSEQSLFRPHGFQITGMCCGADGSLYLAKRNQGWGPNDTVPDFAPNGQSEPYTTIVKIDPDGTLEWMADTGSILEAYDSGHYSNYFNDLPYPGKANPDPSIGAIAVNSQGIVAGAGRLNASDASAFGLSTVDGSPVWSTKLVTGALSVREAAAAVDGDGGFWFAGDRNNGWDGAASHQAHLWKLRQDTGLVVSHFDVNEAVSALGVACPGDGRVFYVMAEVGT